ncbi:contact-dependent growth inhibition system immunity protein [Allohahella sp. A8]|uniref:contact-dependent growth inhibition system immunity protein n=1 Tax=Allohahella sp. A8 TaxID=3141461 RepID=UPI003A80F3BB
MCQCVTGARLSKSLKAIYQTPCNRPANGSHLAKECERLWSVPLSEMSVEDLRLLIGQGIGLEHIVPLALAVLADNPRAEGKLYRGDLLTAVAGLADAFWHDNPELNNLLIEVRTELEIMIETGTELMPALSARDWL